MFIQSHSTTSGRVVILEDDSTVAYLYLTQVGSQAPESDALAYMRAEPPEKADWAENAKSGQAPLLSKDVASSEAVIADPSEQEFSFRWSNDGHSAVLEHKGRAIALVSSREKRGYSRAAAKDSSLVNRWSDDVYEKLFGL